LRSGSVERFSFPREKEPGRLSIIGGVIHIRGLASWLKKNTEGVLPLGKRGQIGLRGEWEKSTNNF